MSEASQSTRNCPGWSFLKNVSVEPMIMLYIMSSYLSVFATQDLELQRACRIEQRYTDEICDTLGSQKYPEEERTVQNMVAAIQGWKMILQCSIPMLFILFAGAWSDRQGRRKFCILLPIFGEILTAIGLIYCTYHKDMSMEAVAFIDSFFPAITGSWVFLLMGTFSYIADISSTEQRVLRIGVANILLTAGIPIGTYFGGMLLKPIGSYGIFVMAIIINVIAILYGYYYVNEPEVHNDIEKPDTNVVSDFFNLDSGMESLNLIFEQANKKKFLLFLGLMATIFLVNGPIYGEMNIMYLYTRRQFMWNEAQAALFSSLSVIMGILGTSVSIFIFSLHMKVSDEINATLSCFSKFVGSMISLFAIHSIMVFFVGSAFGVLFGGATIILRAITSKLVRPDQYGKVFALYASIDALSAIFYTLLYAELYATTMDDNPESFMLVSACSMVLSCLIFLWMHKKMKQEAPPSQPQTGIKDD